MARAGDVSTVSSKSLFVGVALSVPYLDAVNIDLKFFKDSSYQRMCSAKLGPVLDSIQLLNAAGVWVEVTTLIIPGENDTLEELTAIAKFIAAVNKDIPWHISRFHADYKFKDYESREGINQGVDK